MPNAIKAKQAGKEQRLVSLVKYFTRVSFASFLVCVEFRSAELIDPDHHSVRPDSTDNSYYPFKMQPFR